MTQMTSNYCYRKKKGMWATACPLTSANLNVLQKNISCDVPKESHLPLLILRLHSVRKRWKFVKTIVSTIYLGSAATSSSAKGCGKPKQLFVGAVHVTLSFLLSLRLFRYSMSWALKMLTVYLTDTHNMGKLVFQISHLPTEEVIT